MCPVPPQCRGFTGHNAANLSLFHSIRKKLSLIYSTLARAAQITLMSMDNSGAISISAVARETASQLPAAEKTYPFGPDWEVWKVCGKVFALLTAVTGEEMAILKSDPEEALSLRAEFPTITPGYHMNKKHWISVLPGTPADLVMELTIESYRRVVLGLPRSRRPIDPDTFGLPAGPA